PKRSHFLPETQTILHYLLASREALSKLMFVRRTIVDSFLLRRIGIISSLLFKRSDMGRKAHT
ncbi:MAG: hypothetical protein Q4C77_19650, partial [Eubacteriales bacterium]|nr:hypothetical protein [Eubacteriales bacterium]